MYRILRTELFSEQLREIISYIADDAGSVRAALDVLDTIEHDILRLGEFPECGAVPRYPLLRRRGYRILVTMRWLVFYKCDHAAKTVTLYAIADHKQEYAHLL